LAALGAAAWLILPAPPARATCIGGACTCSIASDGAAFGGYDALRQESVSAVGSITVTCRADVKETEVGYEIVLGAGRSQDFTQRVMTSDAAVMRYNLYTDAARTTVWGDGSGATATVTDSYLAGAGPERRSYSVYGLIPGGQNLNAGSYGDTVVVTVIY
jgi:spore coat protein U-like protein